MPQAGGMGWAVRTEAASLLCLPTPRQIAKTERIENRWKHIHKFKFKKLGICY